MFYENVLEEVVVGDDMLDINVDISSPNSPISITNETNSNENSMSSFPAADNHKFRYRDQYLTPSENVPENFFTETDDDMKPFDIDPNMFSLNLNDDSGFATNNLFPIKEEPCEMDAKFVETPEETLKKATRRRIKQETTPIPDVPK